MIYLKSKILFSVIIIMFSNFLSKKNNNKNLAVMKSAVKLCCHFKKSFVFQFLMYVHLILQYMHGNNVSQMDKLIIINMH